MGVERDVPPEELLQISLGVMDASQNRLDAKGLGDLREMIMKCEDVEPELAKIQPVQFLYLYSDIASRVNYRDRIFDDLRQAVPMRSRWFYTISMGEPGEPETKKSRRRGSAHTSGSTLHIGLAQRLTKVLKYLFRAT